MFWVIFILTGLQFFANTYNAYNLDSPEDEKYIHAMGVFIYGAVFYWSASNLFGGG